MRTTVPNFDEGWTVEQIKKTETLKVLEIKSDKSKELKAEGAHNRDLQQN
eukprot:CAMPEP_0168345050 /NCGR_PEP_ID=MMETSP0213-20121227/17278_1 /TAXON_ID=151035 /ORGANISM="Euplotes harpa, Strain FSP1.4" /LENGTH=49 /DNA_ID=CAMNT_0008353103 /DNA_START=323 /DNA_END=472 /DNA_ORIENTATION=+